ncbi:MAG: metallophosphoesterase [Deltaproteobacteria bacterium]|nr:metallophosphoesterase [Deltaproteobacteria bacterium]
MNRILSVTLTFFLCGCSSDGPVGEADIVPDRFPAEVDAGYVPGAPFRFVVLSDTHIQRTGEPAHAEENLAQAVQRINTEFPSAAFVAVTGDLVDGLLSEEAADYVTGQSNPAETYRERMEELTVPYYSVLGNHDYNIGYDEEERSTIGAKDPSKVEAIWKKVLGIEPYYSVVYNGIRLVFLDSARGEAYPVPCTAHHLAVACTGSFDGDQLAWLEGELAEPEPAVLFFHHPVHTDDEMALFMFNPGYFVQEGDRFYEIAATFKDRIVAIFVGHGHTWEHDNLNGTIPVYETGSLGGFSGHPDNMHIVDVDPAGPTIKVDIGRPGIDYLGLPGERKPRNKREET